MTSPYPAAKAKPKTVVAVLEANAIGEWSVGRCYHAEGELQETNPPPRGSVVLAFHGLVKEHELD